jgi:glucosamine--fructose-6-phosphate aminotransferase (isomerizing)
MCGIVGYVGGKDALPILLESLKKLEYRGYDSSGVGFLDHDGRLIVHKAKGKIRNLEDVLAGQPVPFAHAGICHTRWATHGFPSDVNAHPHTDSKHTFAVVHNGIVENYQELKAFLRKRGCKFVSETDSEVIPQLIAHFYKGDLAAAVRQTIARIRGTFALGIISRHDPDTIIAARVGSPLIIGIGEGENFIASDVPAILDLTRKVIYLKDGHMAVITKQGVSVSTFEGKKVRPQIDTVSFNVTAARKDGYPYFMLKEIHEQPDVLEQMLKLRLKNKKLKLEGMDISDNLFKQMHKVTIVACGTAYHAGLVGKYIIESLAAIPVEVETSSEFRYRNPIIDKHTLVVAISQSGETADTLAAVREARGKGARLISICNVVGSSLARESDGILYTYAGQEIGVASTKAYTAQLMMVILLALKLGQARKKLSSKQSAEIIRHLVRIPALYREVLKDLNHVQKIAEANSHFGCFLFLGRHVNYPSALEGALKLKEISYIPAEGYAAGEMKHGPIALIDEYRAVVCINPESHVHEKMFSNIQEVRARRANVIAIVTRGDQRIKSNADYVIETPKTLELLSPLLMALPLQMLAYFIAVRRGCDVDQPRNLAKSVTVE